jgi:3-oxoacyl-[acyl-carrier protein] reductase
MDLGLREKVALITGTGSQKGFGKAISLTLAEEGCHIIASDIDFEGATKTASEVKSLGRKAIAIKADIRKVEEVRDMVERTLEEFERIDILVNNAGAISGLKPFIDKTEDELDMDIDLNLRGAMNCTRAVLSQMISRGSGKIINISSIGAKKGKPKTVSYGAAKAGIIGLTQNLGVEVAGLGINVNCIAPGLGVTNFGGGTPPPEILKKAMNTIPLKRTTSPQDIANAVAFLASDVSQDIVGQTISVDGGESII